MSDPIDWERIDTSAGLDCHELRALYMKVWGDSRMEALVNAALNGSYTAMRECCAYIEDLQEHAREDWERYDAHG